jgi:radical SAM superfamily enzyme YgiQ (UPF0313 family)
LIAALAEDLERGIAKPQYKASEMPPLDRSPLPDLTLINTRHYSSMAIQYSRGCPFNCEFCDIIEIYGRKPRTKSVAQVIAELEQLYWRKWRGAVFLVDDNFIGNKRNVKQLLPALAEWNDRHRRPFTFFTEASMNLANDPELLALMEAAGFIRVFLGIETPVEASLKRLTSYRTRSAACSTACAAFSDMVSRLWPDSSSASIAIRMMYSTGRSNSSRRAPSQSQW